MSHDLEALCYCGRNRRPALRYSANSMGTIQWRHHFLTMGTTKPISAAGQPSPWMYCMSWFVDETRHSGFLISLARLSLTESRQVRTSWFVSSALQWATPMVFIEIIYRNNFEGFGAGNSRVYLRPLSGNRWCVETCSFAFPTRHLNDNTIMENTFVRYLSLLVLWIMVSN